MGDVGSLSLGAMLAVISIALRVEWTLLLIGVVYVFETASVMLQVSYFKYTKRKYGEGRPQDIITPKMMREVYDVDCDVVQIPGRKKPLIMFKEIS